MWILLQGLPPHLQFLSQFFALLAGEQPPAGAMCMCNTVWTSAGAFLVLYSCSCACNYRHYNFCLVNKCFIEQLTDKTSLRKKSSKYINSFQLGYHVCFGHQTFHHLHWEGEVQDGPSVLHHLGIKWYVWERNNTVLQVQLNITSAPMFQNRCYLLELTTSTCIPFQIPKEKIYFVWGEIKIF